MNKLEKKSEEGEIELTAENGNLLLSFGANISKGPRNHEFTTRKYEQSFPGFKIITEYPNDYESHQKAMRGEDPGYKIKLVMDKGLKKELKDHLNAFVNGEVKEDDLEKRSIDYKKHMKIGVA